MLKHIEAQLERRLKLDPVEFQHYRFSINEMLIGMELPTLLSLVIGLKFTESVTTDDIECNVPFNLDALPWLGSERYIADGLVRGLRERGHDDDQINAVVRLLLLVLGEAETLGRELLPERVEELIAMLRSQRNPERTAASCLAVCRPAKEDIHVESDGELN